MVEFKNRKFEVKVQMEENEGFMGKQSYEEFMSKLGFLENGLMPKEAPAQKAEGSILKWMSS